MGYTQAYLAEVTGFSTSFISDLENGKPTAELEKALFLANLLGLDVEICLDDAAEELFQMGYEDVAYLGKTYMRTPQLGLCALTTIHQKHFVPYFHYLRRHSVLPCGQGTTTAYNVYSKRFHSSMRELVLSVIFKSVFVVGKNQRVGIQLHYIIVAHFLLISSSFTCQL